MLTAEQLHDKLRGPVVAMTTHFKDDYSLDLDAMKRLTEFYVEQKVPTVIVTGSTGEYGALTDDERHRVQKTVIDTAQGSGMTVIAGASAMASLQCVELTKYAEGVIANPRLMLGLVESCNGHAGGFKDGSGNYTFYRSHSELLAGKVATMGSSGMRYYLWGFDFGSPCFLTGVGNIWPKWEIDFYQHLVEGRRAQALKIVKEQDIPYADVTIGTKRYWSCVKALQEMAGLPGGPMRPPPMDCTPEQRDELRRVCTLAGLM